MLNIKPKKYPKKLSIIVIALLIAGFLAPLATVVASNDNGANQGSQTGNGNNTDTAPNATENSNQIYNGQTSGTTTSGALDNGNIKQYNKTDITPKGETEQIRAQEQTMFQYRNMTMLMNCTQNCTVSFTADDEVTPKRFSLSVEPNQTMALNMNLTKSPLNGARVNERALNFYLGIEPNATLQLQAQIRLYINQTELNQNMNREVNTSRLTWMYWNQTQAQWETVESSIDQNSYLVCNTDHFSTWTVAELEQPAETTTTPSTEGNLTNIEYVVFGVVTAAVIVSLGLIAYKRRK